VGIGRPRFTEAVEDFVLSSWYEDQRNHIVEIVDSAAAAVTAILAHGLEKAMTEFNPKQSP
jgi:peptidyl-tRNA hydrolase